jgi:hypothetical protein
MKSIYSQPLSALGGVNVSLWLKADIDLSETLGWMVEELARLRLYKRSETPSTESVIKRNYFSVFFISSIYFVLSPDLPQVVPYKVA